MENLRYARCNQWVKLVKHLRDSGESRAFQTDFNPRLVQPRALAFGAFRRFGQLVPGKFKAALAASCRSDLCCVFRMLKAAEKVLEVRGNIFGGLTDQPRNLRHGQGVIQEQRNEIRPEHYFPCNPARRISAM